MCTNPPEEKLKKTEGFTLGEGVVINLAIGKRFKAASKHGLPFVAFTRSESFALAVVQESAAVERLPEGPRLRYVAYAQEIRGNAGSDAHQGHEQILRF